MTRSLAELAEAIGIPAERSWTAIAVGGVTEDSRCLRPGDAFVAVRGHRVDGDLYVSDATARGASAVFSERCGPDVETSTPWLQVPDSRSALSRLAAVLNGDPTRRLHVVGVTGTNGKTTVCHLVAGLLGAAGSTVISTVSNEGRGLRAVTTPSSPLVQRIAAEALEQGRESLVIEVSSAALSQCRVDDVDFDVVGFTNLTHDHLDLHGDMDGYLAAKLRLFERLKATGAAVVNADDPAGARVLAATRGGRITFSSRREADVRALDVRCAREGSAFTLAIGGAWERVQLPIPGRHNVDNALAAAGIAWSGGMHLAEIARGLSRAAVVEGRYQRFRARDGTTAVVDFAHTPDALETMLRSLRGSFDRLVCVLGCAGDSDREKRPQMGGISGRWADVTILTSDNPKHEDPERIIEEIASGMRDGDTEERIVDRREAIRRALALAAPGGAVLIAGKGHEPYQIVRDDFRPYRDADVLQELGLVEGASQAESDASTSSTCETV